MNKDTAIIVPCYNESKRLNSESFINYTREHNNTVFYFVNDGSTDNTIEVLQAIQDSAEANTQIIDIPDNKGKAESVRSGMLKAFASKDTYQYLGYWDADLATPLDEIDLFRKYQIDHNDVLWVSGARIKKGGCNIIRSPYRHYLGRIFVTFVDLILSIHFYDTQCGAKLIRRSAVEQLFNEPFVSKWIFDIELILRLRRHPEFISNYKSVMEKPLDKWRDVSGSKVKASTFFKALIDVVKIYYKTY